MQQNPGGFPTRSSRLLIMQIQATVTHTHMGQSTTQDMTKKHRLINGSLT